MIAGVMLLCSFVYLLTRIQSYYDLLAYRETVMDRFTGNLAIRYHNVELVHLFTIAHSVTCLSISVFAFMLLRKNHMFEKKQYYIIMSISLFVSTVYFAAIIGVVVKSTTNVHGQDAIIIVETIIDFLAQISNGTFSFIFALLMNFVLLFFIFCLNLSSAVMSELILAIEKKR